MVKKLYLLIYQLTTVEITFFSFDDLGCLKIRLFRLDVKVIAKNDDLRKSYCSSATKVLVLEKLTQ